jgi:hypothetical protein
MLETILIVTSATIVLTLGTLHLIYTFRGDKLRPRDRELQTRMEQAFPVITRQTTMWRAWIGFNASHSFGAILFGAIYGYLALAHPAVLFGSAFLAILGGVTLLGYLVLAKRYFFRIPLRGILLALIAYVGAFAARLIP